jgi:hypothetical protein
MQPFIIFLTFFFIIAFVTASVLDFFLSREQKKKISDKLESIWIMLDDAGFQVVIRGPLYILQAIYTFIIGTNIYVRKGFVRSVFAGIIILATVLILDGIVASVLHNAKYFPWNAIGNNIKVLDPLASNYQAQEQLLGPDRITVVKQVADAAQWIINQDSVSSKIIYTFIVVPISLVIGGILFYVSFALSNIMLKEAIASPNWLSLMGVSLVNLIIVPFICTCTYLTLMPICSPQSMPFIIYTIMLLITTPVVVKLILIPIYGLVSILLVVMSPWVGDIIIVTISPALMLSICVLIGLCLAPFHKHLYRLSSTFILRVLEHEKGVVYLLGCISGGACTLIGLITRLLSH